MTNAEPSQPLLRQRDVLAWLGIPRQELRKLVEDGVVETFKRDVPGAKCYYRKASILRNVLGKN